MSEFTTIAPGGDAAAMLFSHRWLNHVTSAANRVNLDAGTIRNPSRRSFLPLDVLNDSGAAIDAPFPILRLTSPVVDTTANVNAPYQEAAFKGDTPDADTGSAFVIVQGPLANAVARPAVLIGLSWCKVNVTSAADSHATTIDGDNTKLQGGGAGVPILWKEAGTGDKWALVLLGGGGSGSTLVFGQLTAEVSPDSLLETDSVARETFTGEGFVPLLDESSAPVTAWPFNPSLNSVVRGSATDPLRVFGELYSVERTEDDLPVTKSVFLILGHLDPLVGAAGYDKTPDNLKGQALIHHYDSAATVADGGPCGGT